MSEIRGSKKLLDAIGTKPPADLSAWEIDGERCVIVLPQVDKHGKATGRFLTNVFRIRAGIVDEINEWYEAKRPV